MELMFEELHKMRADRDWDWKSVDEIRLKPRKRIQFKDRLDRINDSSTVYSDISIIVSPLTSASNDQIKTAAEKVMSVIKAINSVMAGFTASDLNLD